MKKLILNSKFLSAFFAILYNLLVNPFKTFGFIFRYYSSVFNKKKLVYFNFQLVMHHSFCEGLLELLSSDTNYQVYIILPGKSSDYDINNSEFNFISSKYNIVFQDRFNLRGVLSHFIITSNNVGSNAIKGTEIHLPHSMVSLAAVYADVCHKNFDIIMCQGPENYNDFNSFIQTNNLNTKLFKTGYEKVDNLNKRFGRTESHKKDNNSKKCVILAPSWGAGRGLYPFSSYGDRVIEKLLQEYNVIYRPHPKSVIDKEEIYEKIIDKFSDHQNFKLDSSSDGFKMMSKTDLMITDWSGVAFEYYLGLNKPVVYLDGKQKVNYNNQSNYKREELIEFRYRSIIGKIVNENDINEINDIIENEISFFNNSKYEKIKTNLLYNFGNVSKVQKQIIDKL